MFCTLVRSWAGTAWHGYVWEFRREDTKVGVYTWNQLLLHYPTPISKNAPVQVAKDWLTDHHPEYDWLNAEVR